MTDLKCFNDTILCVMIVRIQHKRSNGSMKLKLLFWRKPYQSLEKLLLVIQVKLGRSKLCCALLLIGKMLTGKCPQGKKVQWAGLRLSNIMTKSGADPRYLKLKQKPFLSCQSELWKSGPATIESSWVEICNCHDSNLQIRGRGFIRVYIDLC